MIAALCVISLICGIGTFCAMWNIKWSTPRRQILLALTGPLAFAGLLLYYLGKAFYEMAILNKEP